MKPLSPEGQELVKLGRNAHAPTDADKQRIHEALQQRLAGVPHPEQPEPPSTTLPSSLPWPLISAVAVGASVLAGAWYWASGPKAGFETPPLVSVPAAAPKAPRAAPASKGPPDTATAPSPTPVVSEQTPTSPQAKLHEQTRPKNRLAEEVVLLSRATSALHAGRAEDALRALAEHQQQFPQGLLSVERRAARAQALCQLGRKAEAERELRGLSPSSPQAARARKLCSSN